MFETTITENGRSRVIMTTVTPGMAIIELSKGYQELYIEQDEEYPDCHDVFAVDGSRSDVFAIQPVGFKLKPSNAGA